MTGSNFHILYYLCCYSCYCKSCMGHN